ncbi:MAG: hypothetical protein ABFR90_08855, partial [Planctomycetota bacterium]
MPRRSQVGLPLPCMTISENLNGSPLAFDFGWRSPAAEIAHYVGDNPEGPFKFSEIVMQGSGKPTWDRRGICNSTVRKVGDTY